MSYNRVILMGNLTRDPETRRTKADKPVVQFGLALNEKYQDKEHVTFVDVTMFGPRGEAFARFHQRGDRALIEGRLRLDTWEDKNGGGKRSKLYVVADSFEFCGDKRGSSGSDGARQGAPSQSAASGDAWGYRPAFAEDSTPF